MFKIMRTYCSSSSPIPPINFKFKFSEESSNSSDKKLYQKSKYTHESTFNKEELVSSDLIIGHNTNDKYKPSRIEYIFGIFPILLSLKAQRRSFKTFYYKKDVLSKNDNVKEIFKICQTYGIPSYPVTKGRLNELAGKGNPHQGVCLEASHLSFEELDDLTNVDQLKTINHSKKHKLWLYLDQINDPMNFGAVLRTAYYLGVDKVLTSSNNSCPLTSIVSKASSGAAEILPVFQVPSEIQLINSLKKLDWHIIGSSTSSPKMMPLDKFKPIKNIFLIVGNEGRGISKEIESTADFIVYIPSNMDHDAGINSLNVSVATSILLYSLLCMNK